jgi:hypothetical protein
MYHHRAAELLKNLQSPEAGGAFGSSSLPTNVGDKFQVIAEIVAYRVGLCADSGEANSYPSPKDVHEFLERYIPEDQRSVSNLDTLCSITDSIISSVQRNYQTWYMVKPTAQAALRVAVHAFDQGLLAKGQSPAHDEQPAVVRLQALADQPLWLGCRVKMSRAPTHAEGSVQGKNMAWISKRLRDVPTMVSSAEIETLVDHLGVGAYQEFRELWAGEIADLDEKQRVGVLSGAGRLARELSLEAQGEVILEQVFFDPEDRAAGVLSEAQVVAIERKLGLQDLSLAQAGREVEAEKALKLHLLMVAGDGEQDLFVRRVALEKLGELVGDDTEMYHVDQIVSSEYAPLCVRFAAEVLRRTWSEGRQGSSDAQG